jgi:succinylarginine dihydrolase
VSETYLLGLPGTTHSHAGIAPGNVASAAHRDRPGSPRAAALQVLALARRLLDRGVPVALLPPLPRPDPAFVAACALGPGPDPDELWKAAGSSAFMWAANAATVIPGEDRGGGRAFVLPANLCATPHRALEAAGRTEQLRAILDPSLVKVADPLPATPALADEGAANHHRILVDGGAVHVVVHGREPGLDPAAGPRRMPARQPRAVGQVLARRAGVPVVAVRQHPDAIDAGAFHNDVVMVGHRDLVLVHERAWVDQPAVLARLAALAPGLRAEVVADRDLPLEAAVRSYLFNGVLVDHPGVPWLIVPGECAEPAPDAVLRRLRERGAIAGWDCVDLRESMMGGGGPACLRLRLPLPAAAIRPGFRLDADRIAAVETVVARHWRDRLAPADLSDPALPDEDARARADLTRVLETGT